MVEDKPASPDEQLNNVQL